MGFFIFMIYNIFAGFIFWHTIDHIDEDVSEFNPLLVLFAILSGVVGWMVLIISWVCAFGDWSKRNKYTPKHALDSLTIKIAKVINNAGK